MSIYVKKGDVKILLGSHPQGFGTMNDNGERFADFFLNHSLIIGGTFFPHRKCNKLIWMSPGLKTENQIDYACIDRTWKKALLDLRNKRGSHYLTLFVCTSRLNICFDNKLNRDMFCHKILFLQN